MLTNLDWIGAGSQFPPAGEEARLAAYRENELLFLGAHKEVFRGGFARLEHHLKKKHMDCYTVLNYPQLLSRKTADFVCGEPPVLGLAGSRGGALRAALDAMGFDTALYEAVLDISRFGDAPVKVVGGRISGIWPGNWFPVVDPTDLKHVTHHVVAFGMEPGSDGAFTKIYVEIHTPGAVEVREYRAAAGPDGKLRFGAMLSSRTEATGLDDFCVQVLRNVSHTGSVFGMDDYNAVKSLMAAILWRLHCVDGVLDKHSEPSLSGPGSAMNYDEKTGLWYLPLGNYFKRDSGDSAPLEYLTWDGNLDSSFKELELLINQLYIISEMGAAFLEGGGQGAANSGTALKLRMTSPRIKAGRIAGINTQTVKKLAAICARTAGMGGVLPGGISLEWNDGLPGDPMEEVAVLRAANGGLPVESQVSTVMKWNGVDEAGAREIIGNVE